MNRGRRGMAAGPARASLTAVILLGVMLAAVLAGCARAPEQVYKSQLLTLGTLVDISLWDVDEARAAAAVRAVEAALDEIHHLWHAWEPGELGRINDAIAAGERIAIDAETAAVLREAKRLAEASDHLFNPAIGRLVALWGFHGGTPEAPPAPEAIAALLAAAPTMSALSIDDMQLSSDNPAVRIDLGAFAKGLGVDRAIAALRELGIEHAIVNAGGDLRAIGRHGERAWRVGVRHPVERGIIASLETSGDDSIFTSGDYERHFEYDGKRYHHILDPRSGQPATGTLSVTVLHDNATEADAAATALFVAGPERWREIAGRLGIEHVMLIDSAMTVYMTPAMAGRIRFEIDPPPRVIIEDTR